MNLQIEKFPKIFYFENHKTYLVHTGLMYPDNDMIEIAIKKINDRWFLYDNGDCWERISLIDDNKAKKLCKELNLIFDEENSLIGRYMKNINFTQLYEFACDLRTLVYCFFKIFEKTS